MKLCVMCKHFQIVEGEGGYSEYTPGSEARIGCDLYVYQRKPADSGPWEMNNYDVDASRFRALNKRAETCEHYAEAE